ncbi:alpha/beta hydrolase [Aeromicrobium sp. CTD01-1L150]|uniref:alpha/beta hydrolase n=1 Tax=Aeromicrobium sp. CTD01-1L150 TaxID=3341830 RepID=UPI0035C0A1D7
MAEAIHRKITNDRAPSRASRTRPARNTGGLHHLLNAVGRVNADAAGRLALELWRRPWGRSEVRIGERAVHDAAMARTVGHAGRHVVVYRWGDGARPVLLVHGWGSRSSRYADLIEALVAHGYSPVAYDAPGHGASLGSTGTIVDHEAIMRRLGADHGRFEAIVAHSLGVPFALHAVREGLDVDRVVALNGMCDFAYLVDAFCAELCLSEPVTSGLRRAIERVLFEGDHGIWRRFSADRAADCDLLVVHDTGDAVVAPGQAARLLAVHHDRSTLLETSGLGHSGPLDSPEVIHAVLDFLATRRLS